MCQRLTSIKETAICGELLFNRVTYSMKMEPNSTVSSSMKLLCKGFTRSGVPWKSSEFDYKVGLPRLAHKTNETQTRARGAFGPAQPHGIRILTRFLNTAYFPNSRRVEQESGNPRRPHQGGDGVVPLPRSACPAAAGTVFSSGRKLRRGRHQPRCGSGGWVCYAVHADTLVPPHLGSEAQPGVGTSFSLSLIAHLFPLFLRSQSLLSLHCILCHDARGTQH